MKVVLCGGSGFIGKALIDRLLERNDQVILFSRNPGRLSPAAKSNAIVVRWNGHTVEDWAEMLAQAHAVINLSGEGIADKRWTPLRKKLLIESRINSTRAIVAAMRQTPERPKVFINASAIGYYGNVSQGDLTEQASNGEGFLAEVCDQWENEAKKAAELGVRTVPIRTGVVLEKEGGALARMLLPFNLFFGGPLGNGKQGVSWIHREDAVNAICFILDNEAISGPVNLTAPSPVSMKQFCSTLGQVMHRPSWAPVPAWGLKLLLGEMSAIVLEGQRVVPEKLQSAGFVFKHPELKEALQAILSH